MTDAPLHEQDESQPTAEVSADHDSGSDPNHVAEEDRIPIGEKSAYAMGVVSDHFAQFGIQQFLLPFFNVVMGLSPAKVSLAMGFARLWDAINDPAVGSISDHWKSRFGRRRPFIFVGAVLTGIVFPLIWLVPAGWSEGQMFIWLTVALIVYYTSYSLLSVPYESLGMELTQDYVEKTKLFTFRTYLMRIFDMGIWAMLPLATWLAAILADQQMAADAVQLVGEALETQKEKLTEENLARTIPWVAVGAGLMIILSGILPAFFCKERYAEVAQKQKGENPFKSVWSLLRNPPFMIVMGSIALYLLGLSSNAVLGFYVNTYYIEGGDVKSGAFLGLYHSLVGLVFGILGAFIIEILSKRIDKKPLIMGCVVVLFLAAASWWITYLPGRPYLTLVSRPFLTLAETGYWVLILSMRADVADWDELKNGRRREGMIAALGNWMIKLSITLATVIGGVMLEYFVGFDADLGGDQSPETLSLLRGTYIFTQMGTMVIVFFVLALYPLSRAKMAKVRAELEERHAAMEAEGDAEAESDTA
ncbi:MAG: MFS transporter [Planctomycetota bacterium]